MDKLVQDAWQEFRDSGMLWYVNMNLHVFGWAIVDNINDDKEITKVYPQRVKYRGFSEESNTRGYEKVTKFLNQEYLNIPEKLDFDIQIGSETYELTKWYDFRNTGLLSWIQVILAIFKWRIEEFYIKNEEDDNHEIKSAYLPFRTNESLHVKFFNNMNNTNIREYVKKNSEQLLEAFIEDKPVKKGAIKCNCISESFYHIRDNTNQEYILCEDCIKKFLSEAKINLFPILFYDKSMLLHQYMGVDNCVKCDKRTIPVFNILGLGILCLECTMKEIIKK